MKKSESKRENAIPLGILRFLAIALVFVLFAMVIFMSWVMQQGGGLAFSLPTQVGGANQLKLDSSPTLTPSATLSSPPIPPDLSQADPLAQPIRFAPLNEGLILLAMGEGGYTHLFAYQEGGTLLRLTDGPWNDIHPSLSHDGAKVAFASDRAGQWDLYSMDLASGELTRLTDTPGYEGSPTWSPDGLWMAYESYVESDRDTGPNLELFIRRVDGSLDPIRLTYDPEADYSPAWSPMGRILAFVSTRSGESDVWLADLDAVEERFQNLSHNQTSSEAHPVWSPDGSKLSWSSISAEGLRELYLWDYEHPRDRPRQVNSGDWSAWSPAGDALLVTLDTPNRTYLSGYSLTDTALSLPALALAGPVAGMTWGVATLPSPFPQAYLQAAALTPTPPWAPTLTPGADVPGSRQRLVSLPDMEGQEWLLQDRVDDSFNALRVRVAVEVGWDFLSGLEAAFAPLTAPLDPGMHEDWLYTGRAFSFNTAPVNAGWIVVARQDYGPQTYWRVFLKARFQDGSMGAPLNLRPWDFSARYSGDPLAYENGGAPMDEIPAGYWLDFTQLAATFGWERLPALHSWRLAFSSTQFNKFALTEGQDWMTSMLEIYPRDALDTYTPVPSPTDTPTITLTPTNTATATRKPWYSRTPTNTNTPWPTRTPTPTRTPRPSRTPTITPTHDPSWVPSNTPLPSYTPTPSPLPSYTPRSN